MNTVNIIKGEDKDIIVRLGSRATGDPYDFTSVAAITCCFANADKSSLGLSLGSGIVVTTAIAGKLTISLTAAQTLLLLAMTNATLELAITKGAKVTKCQIPKAYSVLEKIC